MKLAKETKEIDFLIKSEPWEEKDLADFRRLMQEIKNKNKRRKNIAAKPRPSIVNPTN
jgi:hypothetical protein